MQCEENTVSQGRGTIPTGALAIEDYPDLLGHYKRLKKISNKLAFEYRAGILSEKEFGRRGDLAVSMESAFFEEMFRKQP
jgi:hypothetical protein